MKCTKSFAKDTNGENREAKGTDFLRAIYARAESRAGETQRGRAACAPRRVIENRRKGANEPLTLTNAVPTSSRDVKRESLRSPRGDERPFSSACRFGISKIFQAKFARRGFSRAPQRASSSTSSYNGGARGYSAEKGSAVGRESGDYFRRSVATTILRNTAVTWASSRARTSVRSIVREG